MERLLVGSEFLRGVSQASSRINLEKSPDQKSGLFSLSSVAIFLDDGLLANSVAVLFLDDGLALGLMFPNDGPIVRLAYGRSNANRAGSNANFIGKHGSRHGADDASGQQILLHGFFLLKLNTDKERARESAVPRALGPTIKIEQRSRSWLKEHRRSLRIVPHEQA
jgi:hypothetical protein